MILVPAALPAIAAIAAGTAKISANAAAGAAENAVCYESHFTDKELLTLALKKNGFQLIENDDHITVSLGESLVLFHRNEAGAFNIYMDSQLQKEQITAFLENLCSSYTAVLQERLYQRVLSRARENGMKLEQEIIHDDNSIELVLKVEE